MKKYWKSIEEKENGPEFRMESPGKEVLEKREIMEFLENKGDGITANRRDFLKFLGFTAATAAVVSSCKNPVNKAIPYLIKPEDVNPGEASHYATAFFDGKDHCSIVVKVRDGRPIKIEGNEYCPISKGGTTARVQASLLNLYDSATRLRNPVSNGKETNWESIDKEIISRLKEISSSGGKTVVLTSTVISPSLLSAISEFSTIYPNVEHISYDTLSYYGIREANRLYLGQAIIPSLHFDKADYIVGINCDFLGTWLSPVEFSRQYADTRRLTEEKKSMSRHVQFETGLSITGSSADIRIPVSPSEEGNILTALYAELAGKAGNPVPEVNPAAVDVKEIADGLWRNKKKSLLVSGSNDVNIQVVVAAINELLGNYGETISLDDHFTTGMGNDKAMIKLVDDLKTGHIAGLIMYNVNPAYDYTESSDFISGLRQLSLCVSTSPTLDETAKLCQYVCPDSHYLESWGDAEPKNKLFGISQPVIPKLSETRSFLDTILAWSENTTGSYQFIMNFWEKKIFPLQSNNLAFNDFWTTSLQLGFFKAEPDAVLSKRDDAIVKEALSKLARSRAGGTEVMVYESIALGKGAYANNPWLQELPDPVSKVTWDNYAAISPKTSEEMGLKQGDILKINDVLEIPVLIQPGQAAGTVSIALGYGRTDAGKAGSNTGKNAFPLVGIDEGVFSYWKGGYQLTKTSGRHEFAQTQIHHTMEGRPIIRETNLPDYQQDPASGNELHAEFEKHHQTLYPEVEYPVHHWGMAIDLNACNGCSNCVIACQAENNIPVIGKAEVARKRLMHWIRIDRYYSAEGENPEVVFQPLLCQHCDNAPCENVCPVAATTHSQDGLNQMAYNRCIGTKYCINNCPYKVRRFNWFRYADNPAFPYGTDTELGKMVLNPDVTVRERGVVEKCSFCVQRIQEGKLKAKREGRLLADGEILPACAQSCPSKAIVFGDLNDPESRISKLMKNPRNYHLLEELHTLPSVGYLTKVRNKPGGNEEHS